MHAPGQPSFASTVLDILWPGFCGCQKQIYQIKVKLEICSIAYEQCVRHSHSRKHRRYRLKVLMIWNFTMLGWLYFLTDTDVDVNLL
jgi:hypothetical protein